MARKKTAARCIQLEAKGGIVYPNCGVWAGCPYEFVGRSLSKMSDLAKQFVVGSVFALGVAVAPVSAQHGAHGGDKSSAALPKCPITGAPVNLAVSVETDDGPVFFCCAGCIAKYKADPAKYATKVAAQRKALAARPKTQVTCPVSQEPADPEVFVERDGKKVYFCCKGCAKKYKKNPDEYATSLANSFTYQTKCPVTGEEIDPTAFTTAANGMNIYFCCKGCDKKFFKDPKKYAPNLVAQGFTVDAKGMVHGEGEHGGH